MIKIDNVVHSGWHLGEKCIWRLSRKIVKEDMAQSRTGPIAMAVQVSSFDKKPNKDNQL